MESYMNYLKAAAIAVAGLIALAGCQKAAENTAADEAVIRAETPAWVEAYNAGEVEKIVAAYWEDAVLQPPGAPAAAGSAAIREFIAADTAASKAAGVKLVIAEGGVIDVSGDLAYDAGSYSVVDGSGKSVDKGKYLGVYLKKDGKWKYIRDTWNSDNAPAPAAAPAPDAAVKAPAG
jgi:ketosteroid isomerase-like protein